MKLKNVLLWAGGLYVAYQVFKPKTPPNNPNGGYIDPELQSPPVVERGGITLKRLRTV